MRAYNVANEKYDLGNGKTLEFDSGEYTGTVTNIESSVSGLILKEADGKVVAEACGTESLDTVTEFWNRVHKADESYRLFVVRSVYNSFMKIGQQILEIDTEASQHLSKDGKEEVNYSGNAQSKTVTAGKDKVVGYKPKTKDNNAKTVQQLLLRAGINVQGGADGYFGSNTAKAVIEFQKKYGAEFGLTVCQYGENGELTYVDEKTLEAMRIVAQRNNNSAAAQGQYGNEPYLDLDGSTVTNKRDWLQWAAAQNGFEEAAVAIDRWKLLEKSKKLD